VNTFGARLKAARIKVGLTQDDLADRLGITKSAVSAYENNAATPGFDRLPAIRAELEISLDELICGDADAKRLAMQAQRIADGDSPVYAAPQESLTRDEQRMLRRFRALSQKRQRATIEMLADD
jgi:transcriptional regulator with XRE-family HTH domain